ncbi:hypothetical protein ACHHYP_13280 [Achlya hypogyna]|uniref:Protein kinase domain-containing protein n=1 Tax=Achlya hypogyna TaxID=1202772 RepID=A0A1V9YFN3_ACHHY|nr:hypothetical protein ACHHYP_13280 [Achlya hypogyna]
MAGRRSGTSAPLKLPACYSLNKNKTVVESRLCQDGSAWSVDVAANGTIALEANISAVFANITSLTILGRNLVWTFSPPASFPKLSVLTFDGLASEVSLQSISTTNVSALVIQNSLVSSLSLANFTSLRYMYIALLSDVKLPNVSSTLGLYIDNVPMYHNGSLDGSAADDALDSNSTTMPVPSADASASGSTMSALAVVAIILSVVAGFALVVLCVMWLRRRRSVGGAAAAIAEPRVSNVSLGAEPKRATTILDASLTDPALSSFPDYLRLPAPTRLTPVKTSRNLLQGSVDNRDVVVKFVSKQMSDVDVFLSDLWHVATLEHKNLAVFMGVVSFPRLDDSCVGAVVELLEKGSLASMLHSKKVEISEETTWTMCLDVTEAVQYVHGRGRTVPDLTSRKFLVSANMEVKLNVLSLLPATDLAAESFGSRRRTHKAPEVLRDAVADEYAADVYSLGLLLAEICTRAHPFASEFAARGHVGLDIYLSDMADTNVVILPYDVATALEAFPIDLQTLLLRCWSPDPCSRPGLGEVQSCLQTLFEDDYQL